MASSTVLVTGASSGIGRELTRLFARDRYDLVLVARQQPVLESLAAELTREFGIVVHVIALDLADRGAAGELHAQLRQRAIDVDVLVNNAGFGMQGAFVELEAERQLQMIQLNVSTLTALTRLLLPAMIERRRGGVLNVGSTAAFQPGPLMAVYYATKAFVVSFSEALADEVAGSGVRVSCLAPGPTTTGFAAEAGAERSRLFQGTTMSAAEVARIGYDGWQNGTPLVIAGTGNRLKAMLVRFMPRAMVLRAVRELNAD